MKKFILLLALTSTLINFSNCQNIGEEYAGFKVCKNLKKALKNKSEVVALDLSNNKLTSLPANIGELQNLKVLKLYGNRIKNFPESFWQLKQLEVLIISDNGLDSLPRKIGLLGNLKKLYASRNHISSIPSEIINLRDLKTLDLSFNNLNDSDANFIRKALPNCFVLVYMKL